MRYVYPTLGAMMLRRRWGTREVCPGLGAGCLEQALMNGRYRYPTLGAVMLRRRWGTREVCPGLGATCL
jgi:hypothetical protein